MYTFNTNFLFLHASLSLPLSLCLDLGLFIHLSVCLFEPFLHITWEASHPFWTASATTYPLAAT